MDEQAARSSIKDKIERFQAIGALAVIIPLCLGLAWMSLFSVSADERSSTDYVLIDHGLVDLRSKWEKANPDFFALNYSTFGLSKNGLMPRGVIIHYQPKADVPALIVIPSEIRIVPPEEKPSTFSPSAALTDDKIIDPVVFFLQKLICGALQLTHKMARLSRKELGVP